MLRKFWHWFVGESDTHLLLKSVLEQQAKVTESIMDASKKQSDVLASYIDLFKPHVGDTAPEVWTDEGQDKWQEKDLLKMGYPKDKTPAEQAEWVLENISRFE